MGWNPRAAAAIVAECVGVFLFLFVGIGSSYVLEYSSGSSNLIGVALAHGLVLAVLVSAFAAISGGHLNPAVTFGLWVANRIEGRRATAYVLAQLIGALLAAAAVRYAFPPSVPSTAGVPALGVDVDPVKGVFIEAILTGVLLAAVFGTAIDPRAPKIAGLAIGLAVGADILMGGPLTGAAMNPARWFGPAAVAGDYDDAQVWILGPLLGAFFVAVLYRFFFLPQADAETGADV